MADPASDPGDVRLPSSGPGGAALLAIAFVAELALLAGLFWVGWSLGPGTVGSWVLGLLLAAVTGVVWGLWCAPRAAHRLRNPGRAVLKSALFLGMFVLLVAVAPRPDGAVFGLGTLLLFVVSLPADRDAG
jgi:O-antigen/teichoic acid export membrane protein